jgi:hypothetical protein
VGPIQKVLTLLGDLKAKCLAEGEVESEQFEKYTNWCREEEDLKEDSISDGKEQIQALSATMEQLDADISTIAAEVGELAGHISANDADLKGASAVRKEEHSTFMEADRELSDTIDMLVRAQTVLKRQVALVAATQKVSRNKQFVAVSSALQEILAAARLDSEDKKQLASLVQAHEADTDDDDFLGRSAPQAKAYESHSSSILDVLANLKEKAEEEQEELRRDEVNRRHNFEMLEQSLKNELTHQNERMAEIKRIQAEKGEERGSASGDKSSAEETLKSDESYLSDLKTMCTTKKQEFEERATDRTDEVKALEEAINVLSSDQAQNAFQNHLPTEAALLQSSSRVQPSGAARMQAARYLEKVSAQLNSVGLAQLASRFRVGADPFEKVRGMIETMITRLMTEAANEADHKAWCDTETEKSKKLRSKHSSRVDTLSARIDKSTSAIAILGDEVAALQQEVAAMNKGESEAVEQRTAEKSDFEVKIKEYADAQTALSNAIAVLKEYYAKTGSSFLQQPNFGGPIFDGAYEKKDATGVIGILEVAQADFSRMEAEIRAAEQQAETEFKKLKQENRVNRAAKETKIKATHSEKLRLSTLLEEQKADRQGSQKELDAVMDYLGKLKESCTVTPMPYAERKARREQEIAALQEALEILAGNAVA